MSNSTELARQRIRIARETRLSRISGDDAALSAARRDYAAEKLANYIERTVAEAPPLTPEQRDRLTVLFRNARPATPESDDGGVS